jgi:hypothetical protein
LTLNVKRVYFTVMRDFDPFRYMRKLDFIRQGKSKYQLCGNRVAVGVWFAFLDEIRMFPLQLIQFEFQRRVGLVVFGSQCGI